MAIRDYYVRGSNNVFCQVCGKKCKSFEIKRRYDNVLCCPWCFNPRQPQEIPVKIPAELPPSIVVPEPAGLTLGYPYCELYRRQCIPGILYPSCFLPGHYFGYQVGPVLVPNPDEFEPTEFVPEII